MVFRLFVMLLLMRIVCNRLNENVQFLLRIQRDLLFSIDFLLMDSAENAI